MKPMSLYVVNMLDNQALICKNIYILQYECIVNLWAKLGPDFVYVAQNKSV